MRGSQRRMIRRCARSPARFAPAASRARRSCRRRSLRRSAANDGDALVEALAARLRGDVGVVLQRQVDDAPLDRRHRRQELLPPVGAHALGGVAGALREVVVAPRLEAVAIELDVLLGLASDERLVRQDLQRVERLAVLLGHAPRVAPVQADEDLRVVLLRAHVEVEARVVDRLFAPLAHGLRRFGLGALLRHFDRLEGALEVARLEVGVAVLAARSAALGTIVAAIAAAAAATTAAARATGTTFARG